MMLLRLSVIVIILSQNLVLAQVQIQLLSPSKFLGYELGDRFTPHHQIVSYYEHVAESVSNFKVEKYGETYEHRPLIYGILSSPENFQHLEQIQTDNLKRTGIISGEPEGDNKIPVVWLGYNVHGNEAVGAETAMLTLYQLVNPSNQNSQEWLKNVVVIFDPCLNPDGRDRYVSWYQQHGNQVPNPNLDSKEHWEPWPRGRTNHYLFNLNRDWAWQTQVETKRRIKVYNQWLPQVCVDFHEMRLNNPYYFAPSAKPRHEVITPWQIEFQTLIGKNHAKYFDSNGWTYFTKEVYDQLYPSYADTYSTYNGAVGMTYEQGGSGRAGLAGLMINGDTLRLKDRIQHHHTTGMSTVEMTAMHSDQVMDEYTKYFRESANNPPGQYKTYILKAQRDDLLELKDWLKVNQIRYGAAASPRKSKGLNYSTQQQESFTIEPQDLIISTYQPKSKLIQVLFEADTKLEDSLTYDHTSWSIPYAFGLQAYALNNRMEPESQHLDPPAPVYNFAQRPYAYLAPYESIKDLRFLAEIIQFGVKVRAAEKGFEQQGQTFEKGSLVIMRSDNQHLPNFDTLVINTARKLERQLVAAATGWVDQGSDFGSSYLNFLNIPKVAVLQGDFTNANNFGEIWYFFEQVINYQVTILEGSFFDKIDLNKYNVFIIPNGSYSSLLSDELLEKLKGWVKNGGRLILLQEALSHFSDKEGFNLKKYRTEDAKKLHQERERTETERDLLRNYGDKNRDNLRKAVQGAIYRTRLDNSHPLAFGYLSNYFTLKESATHYDYLEKGWNVAVINKPESLVSGFVGHRASRDIANSLVFGVEEMGEGEVVYLVDNPLVRGFWKNGQLLFGNAVFMVGQ
jgi:hypothetical protein